MAALPEPIGDERALRAALGRFPTGVAFISAETGGERHGLIVSSFTSVSLSPPLVGFCVGRSSLTWRRMRQGSGLAIHVLGAAHGEFARRAAVPGADRFADPHVLDEAIARFSCTLVAEHRAGDHAIVVCAVDDVVVRDGEPLVYWRSGFGRFAA